MFVTIEKGNMLAAPKLPDNTVRINKGTVAVASNLAPNFNLRVEGKTTKTSIGIAVDAERQLLRLVPDSINGFGFSRKSDYAFGAAKSKALSRSGLPNGDYRLIEDLTFKYAGER